MTRLKDVLSPERICVHFDTPTKKRCLEKVSEVCSGDPKAAQDYFHALIEREKLGSTALGYGVALPHARLEGLEQPVACFLQLKDPIDFDSSDHEPVNLIFGLFVPESAHKAHLELLSRVAGLFNESKVRDALRAAKTAEQIHEILVKPAGDAALAS